MASPFEILFVAGYRLRGFYAARIQQRLGEFEALILGQPAQLLFGVSVAAVRAARATFEGMTPLQFRR